MLWKLTIPTHVYRSIETETEWCSSGKIYYHYLGTWSLHCKIYFNGAIKNMHAAVILSNLSWTNHCLSDLPPTIHVISSFLYSKHISCMCVNYNVVHHNVKAILTKMQQKPNNWMASGATLTQVTFSGEFFLLQKCLNFCMCFKMFSCIFLGEMLVTLCCIHFSETKCKPAKQNTGECFTTYLVIQKHRQTFKHLWRKKIHPKKSLAPSHSIVLI